jgi:hypothetical protein
MWVTPGLVRNASFFCLALENLMNSRADPMDRMKPASSGFPERLAGFPKRLFTRDSHVIEQSVVQRAQLPPSAPAIEPSLDDVSPARQLMTGFRRRSGAIGFLNE